jgi:microcin C transport system substrate-binding protein
VREALWLLYDFEWVNRVLLYGFYEYGSSLFHNSEMAHVGPPTPDELALLEPLRALVPARVFGPAFRPPEGSGRNGRRARMRRAIELFRQAGWHVRDGRMVHGKTGEHFKLDFVLSGATLQRTLLPYLEVLQKLGIAATIRVPEVSNWTYRMRTGAFDAGMSLYQPGERPGQELRARFSSLSAGIPFGLNWGAIRNPALDQLIDKAIGARTHRDLLAAVRAFDRVFLWNFYVVPGMSNPNYRRVYWDKFGQPEHPPLTRSVALDTWWWDPRKAARVERGLAELEQED